MEQINGVGCICEDHLLRGNGHQLINACRREACLHVNVVSNMPFPTRLKLKH